MDDLNNAVFVYGTLKKGFSNHNFLKNSVFAGIAATSELYCMYEHYYSYPALIENEPENIVTGELYLCSDKTIESLDKLEGHPDYFYRKEIPVIYDGEMFMVNTYFFNAKGRRDELLGKILEYVERWTYWKQGELNGFFSILYRVRISC